MAQTLVADIEKLIDKTERKLTALVRQSVAELIDEAQTPAAKGGKMRVDTGFLRASGQMSLTGMPSGLTMPPKDAVSFGYSPATVLQSGQWKLGTTIYFGWTANYAIYREAYDGFLSSAVQNFQSIVDRNVERLNK